jgi:LPXTG-motif cell wall-anchored protein
MARLALLAAAVLALLALPATALGGGFATVQLSSLPEGTPPGGTWSVELTVLQHGVTPLEDVAPVVRVYRPDGDSREFPAQPTGRPGVYAADVVFPEEGTWRYEIWDGFSQTHTYSPVAITGGTGADSFPVLPVAAGAAAALLLLGAAVVLVRRRRLEAPRVAEGAT